MLSKRQKHFVISMIKSVLRILGLIVLYWSSVGFIIFFIIAEILGIVEEIVDDNK